MSAPPAPALGGQARASSATVALRALPEQLLTVRDVARVLGVSTATVYRLCNDGQLPHVRVANSVRVRPANLRTFVGERCEG